MEHTKLKIRNWKIMPALLVIIFISSINALSQDPDFIPDRGIAERAFNNKDFSTAFKHYESLLARFSADPVYKYYTGACMVELNQNPDQSKTLIREAIINSSSIRNVPAESWYYLGRAYQQAGDFDQAVEAYETFSESARRKDRKELGINELISQCLNGVGDIRGQEQGMEAGQRDEMVQAMEQVQEQDVINVRERNIDIIQDSVAVVEPDQGPGDQYDLLAREALEYQVKADSMVRLTDRYRATLDELSESDRETVRSKILSLEQSAFEYQKIANQKYKQAAGMASEKYDDEILPALQDTTKEVIVEDKEVVPDIKMVEGDSIKTDTIADVIMRIPPVLELFSDEYDQQGSIPVNPELPEGLFYRIQVAAFRNPKDLPFFKGLGPISIYRAQDSDINFYYAGMFRLKEDAVDALVKVKQKGFSDAFIIALMDGSRTSMEKAEQHEKKWSVVSLFKQDTVIMGKDSKTLEPPTLVYRVQVMKVKNKVQEDELELFKKLAEKKSYNIFETADKEYVYLIGKFLTFESAATYADLLYRNGMKEAKVVAYMGKKEIPLETAKKLFELYFEK